MNRIDAALAHVTRLSFALACLALLTILAAYVIEVVARYGFGKPTLWSSDLVNYALCASVFLAMPEITRNSGHVAITSLVEKLSTANQALLARVMSFGGAVLCGLSAYVAVTAAIGQAQAGIETVAAFAIPKWWLTGIVAFGFGLSALCFLVLSGRALRAGIEM